MTEWIAVANGALCIDGHPQNALGRQALVVVPVVPSVPLAIAGEVAQLWRSLIEAPVDPESLSDSSRYLLSEFAEAGIASADLGHAKRVGALDVPWFESFQHELVCALVMRLAADRGIRCMLVKGPPMHAQGLRSRAHSGDVDVLVEPGGEQELSAGLREWGWTPEHQPLHGTPIPHSLTHIPGEWGCEIDVHVRFPGIVASAERAFEMLWRGSESFHFAGTPGRVPERAAHAVIQALTLMRPVPGTPQGRLRQSAVDVLRAGGERVAMLSREIGAEAALNSELREVFPEQNIAILPPPPEWVWLSQSNAARVYLQMVKAMPWRWKVSVLWRILAHSRPTSAGMESRRARWRRGLAQLRRLG